MSIIEKIDLYSHKVTLTFNQKGDTGYKTFIGGLITIISIIFSIICSFYFIFRLFLRQDLSVVFSNEINPFINITYSHELPFLLRLTDTNSLPYENDNKLYYLTASIWYGGTNDTSLLNSTKQHSISFKVGKCDINKHFSDDYKNLFKNWIELNTYYCIEPRNYSQTIYGLYGNLYPFSYYSFTIRHCINTTENNNSCYSLDDIKKKMNPPYLDVVFIDYTINSLKTKHVKQLIIRKERYEISTTIYKRIWLYFDYIKYIIDNGYIFSIKNIEYFHSYDTIKTDFNLNIEVNAMATLTVLNSIKRSIYNKQYTKLQDYLAIIGGSIKVITLFSTLLNYYNSQNSYYLKIIKDFIIENKISEKYIMQKSKQNHNLNKIISTYIDKRKNNLDCSYISKLNNNIDNNSILRINKNIDNNQTSKKKKYFESSIDIFSKSKMIMKDSTKSKNVYNIRKSFAIVEKSVSAKLLPAFLSNKKTTKILKMYKEFINDRLNVINILKKLEIIDLLYCKEKQLIGNLNDINISSQKENRKREFLYMPNFS